jgi:voltage-gated potassium channel
VGAAVAVVALGVAYAVLPFSGDRWWLGAVVGLVLVAAIVPVTVRRVRTVLVADQPVRAAAGALLLLLTMLVVGFSGLYLAMDHHGDEFDGLDTKVDAVYFTVTTLATVGFGDITATGQAARVALTFQMLFDLAFLGVAARVLVTAARRPR